MAREIPYIAAVNDSVVRQKLIEAGTEPLQSTPQEFSDYRGKAVLLNFWATWCQPCKIEMPWFEQLQKQYEPQGVQVIGAL